MEASDPNKMEINSRDRRRQGLLGMNFECTKTGKPVKQDARTMRNGPLMVVHLESPTKAVLNMMGVSRTIPCPDICMG